MKFEKAEVTRIEVEEDIITASGEGCTSSASQIEDSCTGGNHKDKFSGCTNNGHKNGGGQ